MNPSNVRLIVSEGPDKGRTLAVPPQGARLGRASDNDIALSDPILSRHHCRLDIEDDGALRVTDLDSANGTLVNGAPVTVHRLSPGDRILIGDTLLTLLPDAPADAAADAGQPPADAVPAPSAPAAAGPTAPVFVDLGFEDPADPAKPAAPSLRPLLWVVGAASLLLLGTALILRLPGGDPPTELRRVAEPALLPLEIHYEKVEGSSNSIFRYAMHLGPDRVLSIMIDDLAENRHVREEAPVATNLLRELSREIGASGFFSLADSYEGVARGDRLNTWEITVIQDRRVKRCRIANRVEPEVFQAVRERLETFGKNELGIWAIQFSRDKLVELAHEAFTRACNLFDERGIAYGNTAAAIKRFQEAAFYLETIDPKPDFHGELIGLMAQADEELTRRYEDQRFIADRALNLKEWATAARELRILREMVPDRDDPRHIEATRKLLDVENRLKTKGRP
ncbi:MAG: FHA domain-containing protein [Lentisphaerae bacterium]|nr:FHA domain-containing protein [Lentisphaerota bacterium]